MMKFAFYVALLAALSAVCFVEGFAPPSTTTTLMTTTTTTTATTMMTTTTPTKKSTTQRNGIFDAFGDFFEELDAFVDDATSRRLGNGSKFYGKRRSNFYGEADKDRKKDRTVSNRAEDYEGPTSSGYFKWMPDEDGQMRPVTRMKEKALDKPSMWNKENSESEE